MSIRYVKKKSPRRSLIIPEPLSPGDAVGIAAPAGPLNRDEFHAGLALIAARGFRTVVPEAVHEKNGFLAGTDAVRADALRQLFADTRIKAVFCARGGYGSMRILSLLDYAVIARHPKMFVGFSDITGLLQTLYRRCGLMVFHGPMVETLSRVSENARTSFFDALTGGRPIEIYAPEPAVIQPGKACGPLAGGNLATLCHLLGTPFQPFFRDHILFLEDTGEPLYKIDRMLTQMKLAGCFDGVAGLALGRFEDCGNEQGVHEIAGDAFSGMQIPVVAGFDVGHGRENLTLPIGAEAELDAASGRLTCAPLFFEIDAGPSGRRASVLPDGAF